MNNNIPTRYPMDTILKRSIGWNEMEYNLQEKLYWLWKIIEVQKPINEKAVKDTKLRKSPGPTQSWLNRVYQSCSKCLENLSKYLWMKRKYQNMGEHLIYHLSQNLTPTTKEELSWSLSSKEYTPEYKKICSIKTKQPEKHAGFRSGRSKVVNIFAIKIATERRVQLNRKIHLI